MGLSDSIARAAAAGAHALVVEVPGGWRTRAAVERAVLDRGWRLAVSPADADVLVVCGSPGPQLAEAVDVVWHQLPGPRVRVEVGEYDDVAGHLDEAEGALLDTEQHRHDARHRPAAADLVEQGQDDDEHGEHGGGPEEHGDHGGDHEGHGDHGGGHEEHGDHGGGHDGHEGHGDMDMSPSGIPLAEGGEDRDGLEMDVLNVRLGPVLPYWPAGLVLHCALQGDVITEARPEVLDDTSADPSEPEPVARTVDNLVALLALAGWDDAAAAARRVRDELLAGSDVEQTMPALHRLHKCVRRSWLLRWSLRGVARRDEETAQGHGLPGSVAGDVYDRLLRMLDRAAGVFSDESASEHAPGPTAEHVARLVTGLDLATARLAVASLDLHALESERPAHEAAHG